jgi:hypothetical protein
VPCGNQIIGAIREEEYEAKLMSKFILQLFEFQELTQGPRTLPAYHALSVAVVTVPHTSISQAIELLAPALVPS